MNLTDVLGEDCKISSVELKRDVEIFFTLDGDLTLKVVWLKKGANEIICYPKKGGSDFIETIGPRTSFLVKDIITERKKRFNKEEKVIDFFKVEIMRIKMIGSNVQLSIVAKKNGKTRISFASFPALVGELKGFWTIDRV